MFFSGFKHILRRSVAGVLVLALALPPVSAHAQAVLLPPVGQKVALSRAFEPTALNAVTVDPNDPLRFDFFVNEGQDILPGSDPNDASRQEQYRLLIKDFLTALTIPENQLWVNLSPYEKDRIIDERFGLTGMGRDLLAQDYLLKQITAALLYPEENIGRDFWAEVYRRAQEKFGTTDIPVDTFNKVWIMPDTAEVYQQGTTAVVVRHRLKVLMEADYTAMQGSLVERPADNNESHRIARDVMRAVIIPALEKEVNEGKNFFRLRQIYNALILAAWYKKTMRASFLGKAYVDQSKVKGVQQRDPAENLRIYAQYVEAFRKGAFSYIKDEVDRYSGEVIPRKYFSGGFTEADFSQRLVVTSGAVDLAEEHLIRTAASKNNFKIVIDLVDAAQKEDPRYKARLPRGGRQAQTDEIPGIDRIKELAAAIHKLQPYEEYPVFAKRAELRKQKAELRAALRTAFSKYMEGEEHQEELAIVLDDILDGDEAGLRSLLTSGTYTMNVFKLFRGLAMFAHRSKPVPWDEVLDSLGLDAELAPFFKRALRSIGKKESRYKEFYDKILELPAVKAPGVKDNIFLKPESNDLDVLYKLREENWRNPEADQHTRIWLMEKLIEIRKKFSMGYQFLETIVQQTVSDTSNLMFLRVKGEESAAVKASDRPYYTLQDLLAGRLAVDNLAELAKLVDDIDANKIDLGEYEDKVQEKINYWLAKKKFEKSANKRAAIDHRLKILDQEKNDFKHKKRVVVRMTNAFGIGLGHERWYKAVHYLFMLGDGLWTIEVQLKTLRGTILHDLEHKVNYKPKEDQEFGMKEELFKFIWLLDAVETANYCLSKEKGSTLAAMNDMFPSKDKAQVNGGIDVRSVEDGLKVSGQGSLINVDGVNIPDGMIEGFTPLIRSIVPVQGVLLKGITLSARSQGSEGAGL